MPFLTNATTTSLGNPNEYPFNIPVLANGVDLEFDSNVTFFVGENGSGKSTILEAIAIKCGFNAAGGNQNHNYDFYETESNLSNFLRLSWRPKRITMAFSCVPRVFSTSPPMLTQMIFQMHMVENHCTHNHMEKLFYLFL